MTETYPAAFDNPEIDRVEDLPTDAANDETLCHWGNAEACQNDNTIRAQRAAVAIKAYAKVTNASEEAPYTVIQDFLSDLMHLCDALLDEEGEEPLSFDACVSSAEHHYDCELHGRF